MKSKQIKNDSCALYEIDGKISLLRLAILKVPINIISFLIHFDLINKSLDIIDDITSDGVSRSFTEQLKYYIKLIKNTKIEMTNDTALINEECAYTIVDQDECQISIVNFDTVTSLAVRDNIVSFTTNGSYSICRFNNPTCIIQNSEDIKLISSDDTEFIYLIDGSVVRFSRYKNIISVQFMDKDYTQIKIKLKDIHDI